VKLHDLKPAAGSRKPKRRVGRGIAAGQGKTAGRGTKGQKARAGGTIPAWFEGGQTPLHQRIPKLRGFRNLFKVEYEVVNVGDIARVAEAGGFEAGDEHGAKPSKKGAAPITINQETLRGAGLIRRLDRPMKVLGGGELSTALFVVADAFSASARSKIEAAGGTVSVLETPDTKRPAIGVDAASSASAPAAESAATEPAAAPSSDAPTEAPQGEAAPAEAAAAAPKRARAAKGKVVAAAGDAPAAETTPEETLGGAAEETTAPKPRARKPRPAKPDTDA
jgi:large subunit ribosomal protein L15